MQDRPCSLLNKTDQPIPQMESCAPDAFSLQKSSLFFHPGLSVCRSLQIPFPSVFPISNPRLKHWGYQTYYDLSVFCDPDILCGNQVKIMAKIFFEFSSRDYHHGKHLLKRISPLLLPAAGIPGPVLFPATSGIPFPHGRFRSTWRMLQRSSLLFPRSIISA